MGMHCQLPEHDCRTKEVWTEEKRNWCCAREGLGCVKYNCRTRELWTEEKKKWCCANEDLGCDNNQTQPCDNWEWPPKDIKFCASNSECENFEVCEGCMSGLCTCSNGQPDRCTMDCRYYCQVPEYNCRTRELWTEEKRQWCCANEGLGCVEYNCKTEEVWTKEKKQWCCVNEGLGCDDNQPGSCDNWEWPPEDHPKFCSIDSECVDGEQCDGCTPSKCTCLNGQINMCTRDCRMHCQLPEYLCKTEEVWTEEKRNWCCAREGLGCV